MAYREEQGSTFESDGQSYDINIIFALMDDKPEMMAEIQSLDWILEWDDPPLHDGLDISIPILVTYMDDKLLVVDGVHRLKLAKSKGLSFIRVKYVDSSVMNAALLD